MELKTFSINCVKIDSMELFRILLDDETHHDFHIIVSLWMFVLNSFFLNTFFELHIFENENNLNLNRTSQVTTLQPF